MTLIQILILAIVQGLAEMLPVSSSAHVILAEKLMGLDPSSPDLTFMIVMLHTGTMIAAILFFGKRWIDLILDRTQTTPESADRQANGPRFHFIKMLILATAATGVLGLTLKVIIEKIILEKILGHSKGEVEHLFSMLPMVASALFVAGLLILWASRHEKKAQGSILTQRQAFWIGLIQGLCLPFRGLSRSGATISTGLLTGVSRRLSEEFSFALAVVLTPPVIVLEARRLMKSLHEQGLTGQNFDFMQHFGPGLVGMFFSFIAGTIALKWLSSWLENGKWHWFGFYCIGFSIVVMTAHFSGFAS